MSPRNCQNWNRVHLGPVQTLYMQYSLEVKKKRKILDMIKNNNIKYPIVNLIQQCKKKVTIIYVKRKIQI